MDLPQVLGMWNCTRLFFASAYAAMMVAFVADSHTQELSDTPVLRVEGGAHIGGVRDAATDAARRVLVTVSHDKTARIWSLPDLRPLGVLRPPCGTSPEEGKLYAVAVSPDGQRAAVGGFSHTGAHDILFFDLQTRQLVRSIVGLPNAIVALDFSPDGARLAAGLGGGNGVRVWRVADGSLLLEDAHYEDTTWGVTFAPDGRLSTVSGNTIRLYSATGHLEHLVKTEAAGSVFRIRFSPDGSLLALGFSRPAMVEVRDGRTLALEYRPTIAGIEGERWCSLWTANA